MPEASARRIALVTGAGSGIGRHVALRLASLGWRVALVGRTRETLDRTAAEIADAAIVLPADVGDPAAARGAVRDTLAHAGRLDALINNAGSARSVPLADHDPAEIARVFAVNAIGPINAMAEALPALRAARGVIVNVSSMAAHDPFPGLGVYGAAKAALEAACRAIRNEEPGVRAYAVAPGAVETPLLRSIVGEDALPRDRALDPEAVARAIVACVTGATDLAPGGTRLLPSP